MTHKPKNPYCQACCRAKAVQVPTYRGSFVNPAVRWGELLTADYITPGEDKMLGLKREIVAFTVVDHGAGMKNMYPCTSKSTDDTLRCFKSVAGSRKHEAIYSDNSTEIEMAAIELGSDQSRSLPGVPNNNAVIERQNRDMLEGTRSALGSAGLPACF